MGRRKKNAPVRKQDTFMSICKISGWLLFFIVMTGIFTIIATNNLFEKHNVDLVGTEPNYSYSDFVAEGFSRASLNAVAIIFVCLSVTFVLKYILHCKIDCTPIAVASCFIFIFYTAFSLTAVASIFCYNAGCFASDPVITVLIILSLTIVVYFSSKGGAIEEDTLSLLTMN